MAGWSEEIEWGGTGGDSAGLVNVPTGLLLGAEGLAGCARERLAPMYATNPAEDFLTPNAPTNLVQLRSYLVTCVDGVSAGTTGRKQYIRPGDNDYDWTDESDIDRWDMAKMVTELGPEPVISGETNSPVSATWVKWWYDALNLLTRVEYGESAGGFGNSERSIRTGFGLTFAEAKSSFAARSWGQWVSLGIFEPWQLARSTTLTPYRVSRARVRTVSIFAPQSYLGNYTVAAWAKFTDFAGDYDNADYPCDEDTYASVWDDTDVQSGDYDKVIYVGDFDSITTSSPADEQRLGWTIPNVINRICQFDISGGFEFVAP